MAERAYAPVDRPRGAAARARSAAVLGRHASARRRVRHPGLQPVGRARLHERAQLHRPRRRARAGSATAGPTIRSSARAATARTTPSRWPTSSTSSCSATARKSSSEITEVVGAWKRARPRSTVSRCCATSRGSPACTCLRCTTSATSTTVGSPSVTPRYAGVPARVEKRTIADLAEWPYPKQQLVPVTEVVHDRLNVEVFRGCTRGCRFCQAGMITRPVRERPADQVAAHDQRRACGARATTRSRSRRCRRPTSRASRTSSRDTVNDTDSGSATSASACRACESTRSPSASPRRSRRARRTGLTFAPEAGTWRMRQVINKLITEDDLYAAVESAYSQGWRRMKLYFLTGLPDRDRRGHARHRRAWPAGASRSAVAITRTRRSPCPSAGSCRSRSRRSSGSARTPSPS